jgi:outer membrane protein assembly factor BamB
VILVASGDALHCYAANGALKWERPFRLRTEGYLAYAPDGRIVSEDRSGELMLLDAATGETIASAPTSYYLSGISWFSADGSRLYAQAREATDASGFRSLLVVRLDP